MRFKRIVSTGYVFEIALGFAYDDTFMLFKISWGVTWDFWWSFAGQFGRRSRKLVDFLWRRTFSCVNMGEGWAIKITIPCCQNPVSRWLGGIWGKNGLVKSLFEFFYLYFQVKNNAWVLRLRVLPILRMTLRGLLCSWMTFAKHKPLWTNHRV